MDKQGVQMGVRGAQGGQELRGGVLPHGSSGYFPVPGATPESERPRQPTFYPLPRQPGVASMAPASDFKRPLPPQGAQDSNVGKDKQLEVTSHGSAVASMQGINTAPNSQGRNTTSNMLEMKAMARLRNTANPLTVAKLEQLQQFNQVSGADNTSEQKQLMHHLSMMMQSEQQQLPQQMQQQLKQQLQLQRMQQPTQNPQQHLQQQQWRPQQQQFLLPTSLQQSLSHQQQQQLLPSHQHLQQQPPLSPHTSLMSPHQQDQLSPHQQQLSPHHSPHQSPSPHQQVVSPHQLPHQPQQQLPQQGAQFPNPQQQLMPPPSQQPQHKQMLHLHLLGKQQMMQQRQPPSPQQQQAPPQRMLVRQQVPRQPQPSPLPQDLMTAQQQLHLLQDKMKQEQQQQLLYHKNLEQQCLMQSQQQKQLQHNQQLLQQPQQQQQNQQQQQQQQQYVWLNQQQQQQPKMLTDHLDGGVYPPNSGITGLPSLSNPMGGMSALPSRNHTGTSQSVTVMGPPRSVQEGPKLSQQQQFVPMEIGNGVTANASHGNIRLHLHKQAGGSWKAKEVPRNGELPTREKAVAKIILGELMAGSPPQGSAMPKVAAETGLLPLQGCSDGNGQSFESEANPANIDKMAAEYPEYTRLLQMHIGATRVQADSLETVMEEKVQAKPGRKRKQPAQVEGKVKKPRGRPAKNKQGVIEEMPGVEENNSAMYGRQMPPGHQNNGAISSYMNGRNDVTSSTSVHVPFASGPHMYSTHPSSSGSLGTGMEQFSQNQSIAQTFPTGSSAFSGHSSFPQEGSNLQQAVSCSTTAVYSMSPPITRDSVSCNNSIGQKWTPGGNAMVSLPSDCDKTLFGCNVNNADLAQMISGTPAQTGHGYTRADTSSQSLPRNHPSGQDLKLQDGRPAVRNPSANKAAVSHLSRLQASIDSIEPTNQKEECSVKIEGDNTSYRARELTEEEKMAHLKKVIEDVAAGNFDYEPPSRELHHTGKSPSSTPKSGASPYHTPANTPSSLPPIASFQSPSPSSQVETDEASSSSWSHNPHLQSQIADLSNSMELRHAMDSFISTNMLDVPPPPYRPPPQGWNISYEDSESTSSRSTFNPDVTPMAFPDNLTGYHCETNSNKDEQSISMLKKAEELHQRLTENTDEVPDCCCLGPGKSHDESTEGMYYTQLGSAGSVPALREMLEKRLEVTGKGIRIEVIHHTKVDGKSSTGCPLAKWVIRRVDEEEKYLCLAKKRPGHSCEHAFIIVILVAWEGLERKQADELYSYLVPTLTKNGITTERRCGTNHKRSCACQGVRPEQMGASFSFGCAFSTYSNACKFSRSKVAQKFKLNDEKDKGAGTRMIRRLDSENRKEELKLEALLRAYATSAGPVQRKVAPDAFRNMTYFSEEASACRLGLDPEKSPFAGVTACMDFCAHAHRDIINMENGCTVVATLTKHRGLSKADDEQLHVLPHYILDPGGETGDVSTYKEKIRTGALEVYQKFPVKTWIRSHPFIPASRLLKEKMLRKKHEKANLTPKKDGRRRNKTDKELTPEEMDNMDPYELNSSDPDPPLTLKGLKTLQHLPGFADFEQQYMQYRQQMQTWPRVSFLLQWLETQDSGTKNQAAHLTGGWAQAQPSTFSQPQPSTSQGQLTASLWPSLGYSPFAGTCPSSVGNSPAKPVRAPDGPGIVWRETHDNREVLMNSKMGGVAVALGHGSLLFEVARKELHATTPLKNPDRYNPTRISLVLYQHKKLNAANHGNRLWKAKLEKKKREREAKAAMAAGMMMAPVSKEVPRQPEDADIWQMCDDPGKAAERESKPELINTALMRWYNTKMEPKKEKEVVKLEEVLPPSAMLYRNMIHIPVSQASFVETYSPPTCRYIGAPPNVTGAFQFWHFTKNPRDPQQVFF